MAIYHHIIHVRVVLNIVGERNRIAIEYHWVIAVIANDQDLIASDSLTMIAMSWD